MTVPWRVVRSLTTLRLQVNAACPGRATGADGTIGDAAHMAESNSDHDPHYYAALGPTAVVCALDITHDPAHGADTYAMAEALRVSRDPRIGYLISNRRITGPSHGWRWDVYTGTSDPHTGHVHVSSVHTALADSEAPWHFTPGAVLTGVTTKTGFTMTDSENIAHIRAELDRALTGFGTNGDGTTNLLPAWISGFQATGNAVLDGITHIEQKLDAVNARLDKLGQPVVNVDVSAVVAGIVAKLPKTISLTGGLS